MGNQIQEDRRNRAGIDVKTKLTQTAFQATLIFMGTTLASKLLGFLRDVLVGAFFGTSRISDALTGIIPVSTAFQDVVNSALVVALIPLFVEESDNDMQKAQKDLSVLISVFFIFIATVSTAIAVFSGKIVRFLLPGLTGETITIAEALLDIFSVSALLWSLTDLLFGVAQSKKHFLVTAILPLFANTSIILSLIFLNRKISVLSYPVGVSIGAFLQLVLMTLYLRRILNIKFRINLKIRGTFVPKLLMLSIPLVLQQLVNYSVTFAGNAMVSRISEGAVAALSYANKLRLFSVGILTTPLAISFYPFLAQAAVEHDYRNLKDVYNRSLSFASTLIIPASIISIIFSETIIKIVFMRGAFDINAVNLTAKPFLFYSAGIFAVMINVISMRVLYSLKKMNITLLISCIAAILNISLFKILTSIYGHTGISISISITLYFQSILLVYALSKQIGSLDLKKTLKSISKIIAASFASSAIMLILYRAIGVIIANPNSYLFPRFAISGLAFLVIYILMLKILRVDEIIQLKAFIRKLIK